MSRKNKHRWAEDPHAEREAARYERPIPSREFIMKFLEDAGVPRSGEQIARGLDVNQEEDILALSRRLDAMERDGQLVRNRRGGYGLVDKMHLIRGRIVGHADGFGFLIPDEGGDDIFLSAREMRCALHGDRALVRLRGQDRRGRPEGGIVEVIERANHHVVGRYFNEGGVGFVVPDNKRIAQDVLIPAGEAGLATHGQIVVARIIAQPDRRRQPLGHITEVLGEHMAPGMEVDIAIRSYDLPCVWPDAVTEQIDRITPEVTAGDRRGRLDLRETPLVTIDGEDARDFDDAVYCERDGKGWRLLVAIADVSHYVQPDSPLDREAFNRGTSVYFPDRVIPMLPELLSNGLCSLNPRVDRLCVVCEMHFDARGVKKKHAFHEAVMHSQARLTYTEVAAALIDKTTSVRDKHKTLLPHLENLFQLYQLLRKQREQRGAIDFETSETRIIYGPTKKIERIVPLVRNDAHKLIEECMIAANISAAEFLLEREVPAVYRIHEKPSAEKMEDLRAFLGELALSLPGGEVPNAKDFARLLDKLQGREDAQLIQTVLLRSLRLAVYSPENNGHFGLALDAYTHFTSPIRRYPDLLVHRALRSCITKGKARSYPYDNAAMSVLAEHCSMTERRADEATRDAVAWLKCEFMLDKVGEEYDGIISSVTGFGLFVQLKDIHVEGLIHVTGLPNDYYQFDAVGHRLRGERTGRVFRLGNPLRVKVARVDLDERKIDFEFISAPELRASAAKANAKATKRKSAKPKAKRKRR
ncbi:MAG: ribonuclease R [Gammaproteobacteria bacterium]